MVLVNHASSTILLETVPAFTVFMKMKNEKSANFLVENRKGIPKISNLKNYLWTVCALKCFIILQICGIN